MGRLTEIIYSIHVPQTEVNKEQITHLDMDNKETRDAIIELRKQEKRNSQPTLF